LKNLDNARVSLKTIEGELQSVLERRERILKNSRDAILASSRAIIAAHAGRVEDARKEIQAAEKVLKGIRKDGTGSLARYLISPEAEFVEASTVFALVRGEPVPDASSLHVSSEAYLLGLLDTVGELKRLLLVSLTKGKVKNAGQYFEEMEVLYALLSPFAVFDNVVNGVRRKIDVARMITEDTRGVLAEEARRESLLSSMEKLRRSITNERGAASTRS
jgi:translin